MSKKIKFTKDEVNQLEVLRIDFANIFSQLGQIKLEKLRRLDELEKTEQSLLERHSALKLTEQELHKALNAKYGNGDYDPETGIFTPANTEKSSKS